jgi:hypothetical protein
MMRLATQLLHARPRGFGLHSVGRFGLLPR